MNAVTLGWFLCLSTILLIFLLLLFSYISKDEVLYFGILRFKAASVKKVFKVSACVQNFVIAYVWRVFSSSGRRIYLFEFDTYFLRILVYCANKTIHFRKCTLYRNLIRNINMCLCEFVKISIFKLLQ